MVTITREQKGGITQIKISGRLHERTDLQKEIGELPSRVSIVCREIQQINSAAVKNWIEFFSRAASAQIHFSFSDFPPPLVERLNHQPRFACGGAITSVSVPFTCTKCHRELRGTIKSDDIKRVAYKIPPIPCPLCRSKAVFDDSPEEYFAFLIRQKLR